MAIEEGTIEKVRDALVRAATIYRDDQKDAFRRAIASEQNERAKWALEQLLANALAAETNKSPLCDDTGVPHLILELGDQRSLSGQMLEVIHAGVAEGLNALPGRPMAVLGDDKQRLAQTTGLDLDPAALVPAPLIIKHVSGNTMRLHILMQGGGPEIRGKTYRVFHKHRIDTIVDEICSWASEEVGKLGCTPCVPSIGIGRSHFEASALMLEAMVFGDFNVQNETEQEITRRINETQTGPIGLGGSNTALATFMRVGPQRASGVRIVCLRLSCCVEPRRASVDL